MRATTLIVGVLVACGGKKDQGQQPTPGTGSPVVDAPPVDAPAPPDWTTSCEKALRSAMNATPVRRILHVIDGCHPCGDWTPIMKWNDTSVDRAQIEAAMDACNAFCDPHQAKKLFMKKWEEARGKPGRQPWKALGDHCKAALSSAPDSRYLSGPYFALDRIGRAAAADPKLAPLLEGLTLPLPPVSSTGNGFDLPKSPTTQPEAGPVHITVSATQIQVGTLAHATLGKDGVVVHAPGESYPGKVVKPIELPAAIDALAPTTPIALFGPSGVKAVRLLETIASIGSKRQIRLVVLAPGAPAGWVLAGTIPIDLVPAFRRETPSPTTQLVLTDKPDEAIAAAKAKSKSLGDLTIAIAPSASVTDLAKLLGALGHFGVEAAALTAAK